MKGVWIVLSVLAVVGSCGKLEYGNVCTQWGVHETVVPRSVYGNASDEVLLSRTVVKVLIQITPVTGQGQQVWVDAFFDGLSRVMKVRVYCGVVGTYKGTTQGGFEYRFQVMRPGDDKFSPGKLGHHVLDSRQFMFDSGRWFLHLGDTGYRFLIASEPKWQAYIDQAATVQRATKIRAWLASGRHSVREAVNAKGTALAPTFWNVMEQRLLYAWSKYPFVQIQVILYGEDGSAVAAAASSAASIWMYLSRYAQARFSSFPNVQWCVVNDVTLPGPVAALGAAIKAREPWDTLITSHQRRGTGYTFASHPWSSIVTLQTLDALSGKEIAAYRRVSNAPVVLEEDRYESYKAPPAPVLPSDWFRRFVWSALVAGGHPTYGGIQTWLPFRPCSRGTLPCTGVQGYKDMVATGALKDGARDFRHVHTFFAMGPLKSFVGLLPSACPAGSVASLCTGSSNAVVMYLTSPLSKVVLPPSQWTFRVFHPSKGMFFSWGQAAASVNRTTTLQCPSSFHMDCVFVGLLR
jgi:hypothetical protein